MLTAVHPRYAKMKFAKYAFAEFPKVLYAKDAAGNDMRDKFGKRIARVVNSPEEETKIKAELEAMAPKAKPAGKPEDGDSRKSTSPAA